MVVEYTQLGNLDDDELVEIFRQGWTEQRVLYELNEELKARHSDLATKLHLEVAIALRAQSKAASSAPELTSPPQPVQVRDWLEAFLGARQMPRPDGRALYRYRMTDDEYAELKRILPQLAASGRLSAPDGHAGAVFLAYCAEWFRRESESTFLRWDDPEPLVFPRVPYPSKQKLTIRGLNYWGRNLRMNGSTREFLLTAALEGGFPVRILAEGGRGWLKEYLRSIMRRAISHLVDTPDEILALAREESVQMRKSYRHDDFIALCSELVERLLHWRRKAEAEAIEKVRNTNLLDVRYPGWRDDLPIYVPSGEEALVAELLTGLLDEKIIGLSTTGVEAKRYLLRHEGRWIPALQLLADGEIPTASLGNLATSLGRARAVPAGELSKHVAGDLALFEPPMGEQRRWRVRPFAGIAKLLLNFPFASAATATITSAGPPVSWIWPRGDAIRSDILVFKEEDQSAAGEPSLRLVRSGSVSSPAETLYVLFPDDWTVEPASEGAVADVEPVPELDCKLARLVGTAYFSSSHASPDRYRVEPGTEARDEELQIPSANPAGFDLVDERWQLVHAPLRPMIRGAGSRARAPMPGELFSRQPGGRWQALPGSLEGEGLVELSWRDPKAGIQIEKRLLALVPPGARLSGAMTSPQAGEVRLEALPGWTLSARESSCIAEQTASGALSVHFEGRPTYRLPVVLHPSSGYPMDVGVLMVGRDATVALADGNILRAGQQVDLGALRGAVAISPHRTSLCIAAKGARSPAMTVAVDGELYLATLRTAIVEVLATSSSQDQVVELEFLGDTRPPIRVSRYRHEALAADPGGVRYAAGDGSSTTRPVARMILDPRWEHALEHEGSESWRMPARCQGNCLVYLRDGVDVVSRPLLFPAATVTPPQQEGLLAALSISDHVARQEAIEAALAAVGQGNEKPDDLRWLLDASTSLNGLPPSALDVLAHLPSCPEALIRLLLNARDEVERSTIWSLQNELPFLWLQMPIRAWQSTFQLEYRLIMEALECHMGAEPAAQLSIDRIRASCNAVIALEPAIAGTLNQAGSGTDADQALPSLRELASGYVARQNQAAGEGRNAIGADLRDAGVNLPPEIAAMSHEQFSGLFAPILLAAAAQARLKINREQALVVRRALREDPSYVSGAYSHLLKLYGSA